jgi:hypothetical protein
VCLHPPWRRDMLWCLSVLSSLNTTRWADLQGYLLLPNLVFIPAKPPPYIAGIEFRDLSCQQSLLSAWRMLSMMRLGT